MELALQILLVIFATNVVSWIGKSVLTELVSSLPSLPRLIMNRNLHAHPYIVLRQAFAAYQFLLLRPSYNKQRALKRDIRSTDLELKATSSQDQFAKWAKLKRRLDKGWAELEKLSESHLSLATSLPCHNPPC